MGDDLARDLEDKLQLEKGWMDHDHDGEVAQAGRPKTALFAEEEVLIDEYRCLPEGWKFYLRHKATELAEIARNLPPFLFESFRPLPNDATYWQWERDLDDYVRQQREQLAEKSTGK